MSADQQGYGVTIAEAARRLGVSENAIRQRIKRETITAAKVDGVWRVMISEDDQVADHEVDHQHDQQADPERDYQQRSGGDQETTSPSVVSLAARAQLSAIVEEMLAPLVAQHEARTADLARQVGRLEAERDALWSTVERLEAERDALLTASDAHITANEGPGAPRPAATPDDAGQEDDSFWSRFWRALTGR